MINNIGGFFILLCFLGAITISSLIIVSYVSWRLVSNIYLLAKTIFKIVSTEKQEGS